MALPTRGIRQFPASGACSRMGDSSILTARPVSFSRRRLAGAPGCGVSAAAHRPRTSAQWHTGTRTEKSAVLRKLRPDAVYVEMNPEDARRFGVTPQSNVRIRSRRGELTAKAFITPTIQAGSVFIPMHYAATNRLTLAVFDPYSRQPGYKACAVPGQPQRIIFHKHIFANRNPGQCKRSRVL